MTNANPLLPAPEAALAALLAREAVVDTLTTLFVATDERDWQAVREVLTPEVHFDMTSLAGGTPTTLTAEQIAGAWEKGLAPIEHVHHQVGNFHVQLDGAEADASCYGVAYHYRRHPSGRNTRVFVGTYAFRLRADGGRWRVSSFRYDVKFVDGNPTLESDA
jgi:hypothetical protein